MLPAVVLKIVDHMSVPKALQPITRLGLFRTEATAPRSTRKNACAKTTPRRVRTDVEPSIANARGVAFQAGLSFLLADELQFATRSVNANARVTTLISSLSRVGVPFGYVANYSLGHRLRRRYQEETQRIVDRPRFLLPESIDSADWQATVDAHIEVAPDIFKFHRVDAARLLHRCTAAIPRLLRKLLVLTYAFARRGARHTVDLKDVLTAYNSVEFSVHRADVLLMQQQNASGLIADPKRMDLWCPFELPPPVVERARQDEERDREERIRHQFLLSSLTKNERDGYELLGKLRNKNVGSNVVPFPRKGPSVEALLAAERLVRRKGPKP
jgi:hypothetical protein